MGLGTVKLIQIQRDRQKDEAIDGQAGRQTGVR